ncbi:MAG: hypothetical protein WKF57_03745 [Nakamurella sp.]
MTTEGESVLHRDHHDVRTDLVPMLHHMIDAASDVQHYPPPQVFAEGSEAAAFASSLATDQLRQVHLRGVAVAYARVHYVVQTLRMVTDKFNHDPWTFNVAGPCRDALDIGIRNARIFRAPSPESMLSRFASLFAEPGKRQQFDEARKELLGQFVKGGVAPAVPAYGTRALTAALDSGRISWELDKPGTRIAKIGGERTEVNVTEIAREIDPDLATRYRVLSSFTHGEPAQTDSRLGFDALQEGAERGRLPAFADVPLLLAVVGTTARSLTLAAGGLYDHLAWGTPKLTQARRISMAGAVVTKKIERLIRLAQRGRFVHPGAHNYGRASET